MAVNVVRDLISDVLQGILCIHRAGFIHADIKPPNIFVCQGGYELVKSGHVPRWSAVVGDLGSAVEVPGVSLFTARALESFPGLATTGQAVPDFSNWKLGSLIRGRGEIGS